MQTLAIQSALALFREPGRIADFRERPLPGDVGHVIRVAASESAAIASAQEATDESAETLNEASIFYLQQMLFVPNADSYRVLGCAADATQEQLREHYRWLMRWLHPDRNPDGWEVVYADRVNGAWQDLKTPDRRAEYDLRSHHDGAQHGLAAVPTPGLRVRAGAPEIARPMLSGVMVRRLPAIIFGALGISALAVLALMYWAQTESQREAARLAAMAADAGDRAALPADPERSSDTPSPGPLVADSGVSPSQQREVAARVDGNRERREVERQAAEALVAEQLEINRLVAAEARKAARSPGNQEVADAASLPAAVAMSDESPAMEASSEIPQPAVIKDYPAPQRAPDQVAADVLAAEKAAADAPAAQALLAAQAMAETRAAEKIAVEKFIAEKTAAERMPAEKLAAEKLAAEKLAAEKLAAEKLAAEKLAAEKLAAEKLAADKLAADKLAADKLAADKLAADNLAEEKLAVEKLAADKLAADKLAADNLAADKLAADKLAADKLAADKLAAEKLAAEKLAAEKLAADKLAAAEKAAADKLVADKLAAEKLAAEKIETERRAQEKLAAERHLAEQRAAEQLAAEQLATRQRATVQAEARLAAQRLASERGSASQSAAPVPSAVESAPATLAAAPPARNEAQSLVGEMASAYASGNLAHFDSLFIGTPGRAGGAGVLRSRMQSTQMRYLEVGKIDWNLTDDSAVGRVSFRDTFVPRGAKKSVTQGGEIRLIVRRDSGKARISSIEVAAVAN